MHLVGLCDLTKSPRLLTRLVGIIFLLLYITKTIWILLRTKGRNLHLRSGILIIGKMLIRLNILTILIQVCNLLLNPSLRADYLATDIFINSLMLNEINSIIPIHFTRWCFISWHILPSHALLRIITTSIASL